MSLFTNGAAASPYGRSLRASEGPSLSKGRNMARRKLGSGGGLAAAIGRRSAWLVPLGIGVLVFAGAAAYASVPDASGIVHGCYSKTSGSLRVIDSATQTCAATESSVNWSQTGPA